MNESGPLVAERVLEVGDRERIPHSEITQRVDRFATFYNLDPSRVNEGIHTSAEVVDKPTLRNHVVEYSLKKHRNKNRSLRIGMSKEDSELFNEIFGEVERQDEESIRDSVVKQVDGELSSLGAVCLEKPSVGSNIYISNTTALDNGIVLDHEMLHALSTQGNEKGSGFMSDYGEKSVFKDQTLNEATTEILRVMEAKNLKNFRDLFAELNNGVLAVSYRKGVQVLAGVLALIEIKNDAPITVQELADFYFGNKGRTPRESAQKFLDRLLDLTPEDYAPLVFEIGLKV